MGFSEGHVNFSGRFDLLNALMKTGLYKVRDSSTSWLSKIAMFESNIAMIIR